MKDCSYSGNQESEFRSQNEGAVEEALD